MPVLLGTTICLEVY